MQQYGPGLGNLGNLIDSAKGQVDTFITNHVRALQAIVADAEGSATDGMDPAISAVVKQLATAALDDLKKAVTDGFKAPPKGSSTTGAAS